VLSLNTNKQTSLEKLCYAFAREKNHWLDVLKNWGYQASLGMPRKIRDEFIKAGYQSRNGLQARHWKLALQDAAETWDKYWKALFVQVKSKITWCKTMTAEEKHYSYWLLKGYQQFAELMQGKEPQPNFAIENTSRHRIACYVRRNIKKLKKKHPSVKKARIAKFDADCYKVIEHKGRQYLKLMSLERGKRLVIPLIGKQKIEGNLTIVLNKEGFDVHLSQKLKPFSNLSDILEAVDFGYTEVLSR
jgi:putative transposase